MNKLPTWPLALLALWLLSACTSAPPLIQSYSLSTALKPTPLANERLQFRLLNVAVPERLNTERIIAQSDSGALYELSNQLWASPLPDELRSTLSYSLSQKLPAIDVTYIATNPNRTVYRVRVAVQEFFTEVGEATSLSAAWSISSETSSPINCVGNYAAKLPPSDSVDIASFRQLAQQLADEIVTSMRNYAGGGDSCGL